MAGGGDQIRSGVSRIDAFAPIRRSSSFISCGSGPSCGRKRRFHSPTNDARISPSPRSTQQPCPPRVVVLAQCMGKPGELDARAVLQRFHVHGLLFLFDPLVAPAALWVMTLVPPSLGRRSGLSPKHASRWVKTYLFWRCLCVFCFFFCCLCVVCFVCLV